jgi:hypothetical protein
MSHDSGGRVFQKCTALTGRLTDYEGVSGTPIETEKHHETSLARSVADRTRLRTPYGGTYDRSIRGVADSGNFANLTADICQNGVESPHALHSQGLGQAQTANQIVIGSEHLIGSRAVKCLP